MPESARATTLECHVEGVRALSGDSFEVEGGHRIRLIGVDAPSGPLSWNPAVANRARARLQELVAGRRLVLTFDREFKNAGFDVLAYATDERGLSVNEAMVEKGLAAAHLLAPNDRLRDRLLAAEGTARKNRSGIWKASSGKRDDARRVRRGFSLGLYSRDDAYDYTPFLREMRAIGARDVMLITPWFMDHYTGCAIVPKKHRTIPLERIGTVIRNARELGLRVSVMPIVLLWKPDDDHWRGNIAPRSLHDWFDAYQEFIRAFAFLCRDHGADELLVGSEFSSLEEHAARWREVVGACRRAFGGRLAYSANWDHLDVIRWWDAVDAIGMTGYHSLTEKKDPSIAELVAAWRKIRGKLERTLASSNRPYFFSEMGYASLDGINTDPWDYVSPQTVDDREQADCYEAWFRCWTDEPQPRFEGAYFYTWWRNDDAADRRQYTVHGKPAEAVIKRWFSR